MQVRTRQRWIQFAVAMTACLGMESAFGGGLAWGRMPVGGARAVSSPSRPAARPAAQRVPLAWTVEATALNVRDNRAVEDDVLRMRRLHADRVHVTNRARAISRCSTCRTVALSFQIALVEAPVSQVAADNQSWAINRDCTQCVTYASASQFVLVTDAPLALTGAGRRAIGRIRARLRELGRSTLPPAGLQAQIDQLQGQAVHVLVNETRKAHRHGRLRLRRQDGDRHGHRNWSRDVPIS